MKSFAPIILIAVALTACEEKTDRAVLREPEPQVPAQPMEQKPVRVVEGVSSTLSLEKESYPFGEIPKSKVVLHNESGEELVLPIALDGSEAQWRYPHCGFEVFDENKEPVQLHGVARCGNMNTLEVGDFTRLGVGDSLDLSENGRAGFSALYQISQKPGTYWLRHFYKTSGGPVEDYYGDERRMEKPKVKAVIRDLAAEVPKVTVYSEMVKVIIEPKAAE